MSFATFVLATSLLTGQIQTQPAPAASPTAQQSDDVFELDEIVVEGQPIRPTVRRFVGTVSAPALNRGPARWRDRLCVGVVNLQADAAQFLIDRISTAAMEIGLQPGDPGCKPNLVVMMTSNAPALARSLVESRRREFMINVSGATAGDRALEEFQSSERAVRWWHVSVPINGDTGATTVRLPGQNAFQGMSNGGRSPSDYAGNRSVGTASRVTSNIKDELQQVLVIVDVNRIGGVHFDQLADYVAMVGLAQIDPKTDTSAYDTILNLFQPGATAPPGLTDFDKAFLLGLYTAPQSTLSARGRTNEVAVGMERTLRKQP